MTPEFPAVEFEKVSKTYGDGPVVLERFDLALESGDFVSLIGPSGCGKSTVLKLAAGLTPATTGRLQVAGASPAAARNRLAFIFQEPTLLPWLTVDRNIAMLMRLRRLPRAIRSARTAELRRLVGLDHVARHYPRQLSGGMKMRVSIARALTLRPELLLLDEPFGALDDMTRNRLNEELLALRAAAPFTALFVTHSVAEAVFLSNRIVVMAASPGRVHRTIEVPIRYPRTNDLRLTADYHRLVDETAQALRETEPTIPR
jgi:NitT/TauT family transport system ATP-binding protein